MTMALTQLRLALAGLYLIASLGTASTAQGSIRTIEIHAHRYAFEPSEITVKKGETVQLKFISDDVTHSLLITDLGINEPITKSRPSQVTLTPQSVGDFHGRCGHFCGSGHGQMVFTVHVIGN